MSRPHDPSQPSRAITHAPAVAGFAALTAAFFWPLVAQFRTRVLFAGDGATIVWSYWAMPRALLRLDNPFVTKEIFHPVGADLAFHTSSPLLQAIVWPVSRLLGFAAATNLLELLGAFLSAVGAYLLTLHVCRDRRAAFFSGVAFAFVPYRFVHAGGHFDLIQAELLPFGVLAFLRLLERPSRRRALGLGALVGLTFLTTLYYTVFLLLAFAVVVACRWRVIRSPPLPRRLVEAAVTALVVALPLAVPLAAALARGELDPLRGWAGADHYSADLLSWIVPPAWHPVWGDAVRSVRHLLGDRGEGLAYPGLVVLGLAVAGRELGDRRRRRLWVVLAAVMAVLAMGPFLQLAGRRLLPLPYWALHAIPVLNGVRVPGRFVIVAVLALDVLAGLTLAGLARRKPAWGTAMIGAALLVTVVEFLPGRLETYDAAVPMPYQRIKSDPDPGAVLEIPLQWQSGMWAVGDTRTPRDDTAFMYYATVHEKPLVSGYVSRYPSRRLRELTSIPVYRQVLALGDEPGFDDPATFDAGDLRDLGIGFVVYHRDRPQPRAFDYLAGLGLPTLADDGTVIVWRIGS